MGRRNINLLLIIPFFLVLLPAASAQPGAGFNKAYQFLHSGNLVADKDFYLLTVFSQTPDVQQLLQRDEHLRAIHDRRLSTLRSHGSDSCTWPGSLVSDFRFTTDDSLEISSALRALYRRHTSLLDQLIDRHLRPSGYYQRFTAFTNEEVLLHAWGTTVIGINYIIDQYGLGKKMRYPRIDSASFDVNSRYYRTALKEMFAYLGESENKLTAFYHPSLVVAMQLMEINDRDEPARFEPLENGENKAAVLQVPKTNWSAFKYATIVVPGEGPETTTIALDPMGRIRCDLAADRYEQGLAPFIILSGGYCHPFHTPYAEAFEMKKYLMTKRAIPESAIIIEPQARHTTTNLRNASRLMIRYGIPVTMPSDIVSTKSQIDYIDLPVLHFDDRNLHELGYLPYRNKTRIAIHDISFYPIMESLHMDPYDPLDP